MEPTEDDYIDELLERLRGSDAKDQRHAVSALARLGKRAVPALLEALRQDDWNLRRYAAAVFVEAPDARAVPLLCELLRDVEWEVRLEAAGALKVAARAPQMMAPPETVEALLPLWLSETEHIRIRLAAVEALVALHTRTPVGRVPPEVWERAVPALCAAVAGREQRLQSPAARLLGALGAAAGVDALWVALDHAEPEPARRIAEALGSIGGSRVVEPLRVALRHREAGVRWEAVRALGQVGGEEALMLLAWALRSRDPRLRRGAAMAVEHLAIADPTPALRVVLEPLRRLISPLAWPSTGVDRLLFYRVLRRVEQATTQVRDLPLPSRSGPGSAELPLPADVPREPLPDADSVLEGENVPKRFGGWWEAQRKRWERFRATPQSD